MSYLKNFRNELRIDKLGRNFLRYADTLGKGWFGWIIRGQWKSQEVIVKILREEASSLERKQFIEESLKWSRGLNDDEDNGNNGHENVLRLIGVALDLPPFLALMEFCESGDLKTFLRNSKGTYITTRRFSLSTYLVLSHDFLISGNYNL